jgi:hypothetical protein
MHENGVVLMIERVHATDKETTQVILGMKNEVERLTADRDHWRSIAERAMDLLEEANKVLATIQEAIKND